MKLRARLPASGPKGDVRLEVAHGAPSFRVQLDGRTLAGEAAVFRPGIWSLVFEDGRQIEVSLEPASDGALRVQFGSAILTFDLQDELTALALVSSGRGKTKRADVVAAAMPGRVLKLMVAPGDVVASGQPILVLEAMKMENEVKAPREGVVESVVVAAGQAVSAGEILIRLKSDG